MTYKIGVIGAGQIGQRHLQALSKLQTPAEIAVFDPSPDSLAMAQQRFSEARTGDQVTLSLHSEIAALPPELDLLLSATAAAPRRASLEAALAGRTVKNLLLEKIVFQTAEDFAAVETLLTARTIPAWVNCPRRMQPLYHDLKAHFDGAAVNLTVTGNNWGLGCNGVHFVDLLQYLTGEAVTTYGNDGLDPQLQPSKRTDYWEFTGTLTGRTASGHSISLTCRPTGPVRTVITLTSDSAQAVIHEGQHLRLATADTGWAWQDLPAPFIFQSDLTQRAATSIFTTGTCNLATFAEARAVHEPMLASLLAFANRVHPTPFAACPIT